MQNNKGWDFLTTFADINDNYIYQASKPWKENKIVIVQHYIRGVAACILLVAVIGVGLIHQKKVEAAWYKMTSLIGRILGIEKGTDEYVKAIQKTIEKNGIAVSLEEVAADEKSLWVAYSLTDENDENDISMNSVQAAVDGEALALERQYALNNSTGSEKTASKYFVAKFNRSKADRSQKFEIEIGTFQNENGQVEEKDAYEFSFTADPEVLEADTKEIDIQTSIPIEKNQTFLLSEMKYNIFGCTISGSFSDMAEDDEFWLRGKDDLGNEYVFDKNGKYTYKELVQGSALTIEAFSSAFKKINKNFGGFGAWLVTIGITLFAFSTILGWEYHGEKAFEYIFKTHKYNMVYRVVVLGVVFVFFGGLFFVFSFEN